MSFDTDVTKTSSCELGVNSLSFESGEALGILSILFIIVGTTQLRLSISLKNKRIGEQLLLVLFFVYYCFSALFTKIGPNF